jgi:hypothetical protein
MEECKTGIVVFTTSHGNQIIEQNFESIIDFEESMSTWNNKMYEIALDG